MNQEYFDRIQTLKAKAIHNREHEYLNEIRFKEWLNNKRRQEYIESTKCEGSHVLVGYKPRKEDALWIEILFSILPLIIGFFVASLWGWGW